MYEGIHVFFFKILFILSFLIINSNAAIAGWNGFGEINEMYIYPNYAVIKQGNASPGPSPDNCTNDATWSFNWSQFDAQTQNRIQSMLLTAYASKTAIQVNIGSDGCGPENKKNLPGM